MKLHFGALFFFQQKISLATFFFILVRVFGGKTESNQREAILATILEKRLKACLNINVYLRHIGYMGLRFILKPERDFLKKARSVNRSPSRWLVRGRRVFPVNSFAVLLLLARRSAKQPHLGL